jgi:hypothetical protein
MTLSPCIFVFQASASAWFRLVYGYTNLEKRPTSHYKSPIVVLVRKTPA